MAPAIATSGERKDPYWARSVTKVLHDLETSEDGLTSAEVEARLRRYGTSVKRRGGTGLDLLLRQFVNPIILLLVGATLVSLALGDTVDAAIILVIVGLSGLLGFYQERGAIQAVEALLATVQVHCEVHRNGTITSVPLEQVVPGDVIALNAGDVIPGDCRVIEAKDLLVDESPLTGESYPAEKDGDLVPTESPVRKRSNSLFMGTHVASGTGTAVVLAGTRGGPHAPDAASDRDQCLSRFQATLRLKYGFQVVLDGVCLGHVLTSNNTMLYFELSNI